MVFNTKEAISLIDEIKILSEKPKEKIKDKVLKLADLYAEGIKDKNPYLISKVRVIKDKTKRKFGDDITEKDIALLLQKIRDDNFDLVSTSWLYKILPKKYKHTYETDEKIISTDDISEKNLYMIKDEMLRRIRDMDRHPSKDIKIKETKDSLEQYENWDCYIAGELAKLALKMEKEHTEKHDKSLCAKVSKSIRTARDGRFATPLDHYEAMIVAANAVTSLANVVEGEWGFKTRWEIEEDEKNCRECLDPIECKATKCNHVCHHVIKKMTTKGLKFAINTDKQLKELDEHMKDLMENTWQDLCPLAKILLRNKKLDKVINIKDKQRILATHINKDECIQCEVFLDEHPHFFNTGKL